MNQEVKNIVWVAGCYNWPVSIKKEERHKNKNYDRHNWVDIDTDNIINYDSVLKVFRDNKVSCITQRCGRGWHIFGDLVQFDVWQRIWNDVRPYADPRWAPHTLRVTKKRPEERFDKPIFHNFSNLPKPQPWMQSLMHFLCKSVRGENSNNLKAAIHQAGLDKYFECPKYIVELK